MDCTVNTLAQAQSRMHLQRLAIDTAPARVYNTYQVWINYMRMSKKSDYALRALISLARWSKMRPVPIRALAQLNDVPQGFMQQIMLAVKEQGWVRSVAGRDGGYQLAQSPEDLTMGQVVRHFDGVLAAIGCVSITNYEQCSQEPVCAFRRVLLDVRNHTAELLDRTTLAELASGCAPSTEKVFSNEFIGGAGI
jgi:Rrf2 family protein